MTETIGLLLRLAKQEADGRRARLGEALRISQAAAAALAGQDAAMSREAAGFAELPEGWRDWAGWADQAARQREDLARTLRDAQAEEEAARDAVRDALAAMKRLEILQENRDREARRLERRRGEARAEEAELRRPREAG